MQNAIKIVIGDPVEKFSSKSAKILDVFTKTIDDLKIVNNAIEKEEAERIEAKKELDRELESLAITKEKNLSVIGKITKIFE